MENLYIERQQEFINLNNKAIAEYCLIYEIKDSSSTKIAEEKIQEKNQIGFKRIENPIQASNLIFVDSDFSKILSDLCLDVFIYGTSSIQQYLSTQSKAANKWGLSDYTFLSYKFKNFIQLLLFGDVGDAKSFNQKIHTQRVFCLKNSLGEIDYFSIYEQDQLMSKLINAMKVEVERDLSQPVGGELGLRLSFGV
jgi:hypothetical protein